MGFKVIFHDNFYPEFQALPAEVQDEILAVAKVLENRGPGLGRPWVDTLKGALYPNLKELRVSAVDGEWRIAFAFDPNREAILLCTGNKSGISQKRFYHSLIKRANERFESHLATLEKKY